MVSSTQIEPYSGKPDKKRFIDAVKMEPIDRVPNFEIVLEDKHVEKILKKEAGSTIGLGGDPGKGAEGILERPLYPDDYIDLCDAIGQDIMFMEVGFWTPFKRRGNGGLVDALDKTVKNRKDFEELVVDTQPKVDYAKKYIREYKDALERRNSDIGIICGGGCIFQTLYEFVVGMNDFMMMCYEDKTLVEDMLEISTEHFVTLFKAVVEAGADLIYPADDVAFKTGLFIPPKMFKQMWLPRIKRIIEPALEAGVPVAFHSDGKLDDLVDDLIEIGVDLLVNMDPYCTDYRDYKKRYGSRIALWGNVDIEFPLAKGTPEDVEKEVIEQMKVLKPGYGYVAGSSHVFSNFIPHENFITMINSFHKYGEY